MIIPDVTERSGKLKMPVLNTPPKLMCKKSVTEPKTILFCTSKNSDFSFSQPDSIRVN